jgi:hypothetical protein
MPDLKERHDLLQSPTLILWTIQGTGPVLR